MIVMMLCKVALVNHQKYCCMFAFDYTHVIMYEMYHHEYYYVYTIGYHSSSIGGLEGMLQHLISHLFCSQPLTWKFLVKPYWMDPVSLFGGL